MDVLVLGGAGQVGTELQALAWPDGVTVHAPGRAELDITDADAPERIEALVRRGEAAAGFTLYPTAMDDLMAVADSGQIMPPKSTWFEPKLADGLIAHLID